MPRCRIMIYGVLGCLCSLSCGAQVESCYVSVEDNVLTLGNQCIRRTFEWNQGDLKAISIVDEQTGETLTSSSRDLGVLHMDSIFSLWRSNPSKNV